MTELYDLGFANGAQAVRVNSLAVAIGGISAFKKNWLKQARRKRMGSELPSPIFK